MATQTRKLHKKTQKSESEQSVVPFDDVLLQIMKSPPQHKPATGDKKHKRTKKGNK
jgi:hypothetical protein